MHLNCTVELNENCVGDLTADSDVMIVRRLDTTVNLIDVVLYKMYNFPSYSSLEKESERRETYTQITYVFRSYSLTCFENDKKNRTHTHVYTHYKYAHRIA